MANKVDAGWTPEDEAYLILQRDIGVKYKDIAANFPSGTLRTDNACWSRYNYLTQPEARRPVIKTVIKLRPDYSREIMVPESL